MRHPGNEIAQMAANAIKQSKGFQRSIRYMVSELAMDAARGADSQLFLREGLVRLWFHGHVVQDINIVDLMTEGVSNLVGVTDRRALEDGLDGIARFESVLEFMRGKIEARRDALAKPAQEASSESTPSPNSPSS